MNNLGIKVALILIYFVSAALLNSVGILIERSQEVYGVSKQVASYLEPVKDLTIAIVGFFVGSFLPRIGYKKGMLLGLFVVFVGCFVMYLGNAFWSAKVLLFSAGVSFAIVKVGVFALINNVTSNDNEHSSFMNLIETFFMLGIIFMYLVFPLFYDDNNPNAWLNGYLFMAGIIAVAFVIILLTPFSIQKPTSISSPKQDFKMLLQMLKRPLIIIFAIFAFFYVMAEQGIMNWLPTFNKEVLKLDAALSAQMTVILFASTALGRFITSFLSKKINWVYINVCSIILAIILILTVLPLVDEGSVSEVRGFKDLPIVSYLFPLIGLFLAPIYPLVNSTVLSHTESNLQSSIAGLLVFFSAVGGTIGSLVIGYLFDTMGGDKVFYLSLIPFTIIFITQFLLKKFSKSKV